MRPTGPAVSQQRSCLNQRSSAEIAQTFASAHSGGSQERPPFSIFDHCRLPCSRVARHFSLSAELMLSPRRSSPSSSNITKCMPFEWPSVNCFTETQRMSPHEPARTRAGAGFPGLPPLRFGFTRFRSRVPQAQWRQFFDREVRILHSAQAQYLN